MSSGVLHVVRAGTLSTVQDLGRPGLAHLGVPRAGALDAPAAALANRLVGNPPDAAVLEVTLGGLEVVADVGRWVALTGAPAPLRVDGVVHDLARATWLAPGARLRVDAPPTGVRSYLAVAGGVAADPVLGSRSTDVLAGVGPPVLRDGARLPLGVPGGPPAPHDTPRPPVPGPLRLRPGPREDWFAAEALELLTATSYVVLPASNRVGLRLDGPALPRVKPGELPSEGMVLGAVQVPPDGRPVVFLADHPPTGGYPVIGVVAREDLWQCAQLRPGEQVRFEVTPARPAAPRPAGPPPGAPAGSTG